MYKLLLSFISQCTLANFHFFKIILQMKFQVFFNPGTGPIKSRHKGLKKSQHTSRLWTLFMIRSTSTVLRFTQWHVFLCFMKTQKEISNTRIVPVFPFPFEQNLTKNVSYWISLWININVKCFWLANALRIYDLQLKLARVYLLQGSNNSVDILCIQQ